MRFSQFAAITLPALVAADFNVWSGTCMTGGGGSGGATPWDAYASSTDSEKVCNGCSGGTDGTVITVGNPCNPNCGDDQLELRPNGGEMDLVVVNTQIKIGHCTNAAGGGLEACNAWNYACSYSQIWRCHTSYCVG